MRNSIGVKFIYILYNIITTVLQLYYIIHINLEWYTYIYI